MHRSSDDWNKLKHLVDLSAENARLKAENARLKAEVERLRLAGDEVVSRIQVCTEDLWCSIRRWNAVTEGEQS